MQREWQPIETAPLNEQRVLLFVPPYGATTGHFSGPRWHCHSVLNRDAQPTHWMPLPGSPDAERRRTPNAAGEAVITASVAYVRAMQSGRHMDIAPERFELIHAVEAQQEPAR